MGPKEMGKGERGNSKKGGSFGASGPVVETQLGNLGGEDGILTKLLTGRPEKGGTAPKQRESSKKGRKKPKGGGGLLPQE